MSRVARAPLAVLGLTLLAVTVCASGASHDGSPVLQRFLSSSDAAPSEYRALRHLEAHNEKFDKSGWMDVWTDVDLARGFRYSVVAEGGSGYIRDHVMLPALEMERKLWAQHGAERVALTLRNYEFEDRGVCCDGLATIEVKPRRKDALLIDGALFIRPDDGELVRVEGQLVKPPSFWTRHVHIVRWYERIGGVQVPVAVESQANVLIAGPSTFRMTYEYETINGRQVGSPQPRAH